jgi:hypothetical protein
MYRPYSLSKLSGKKPQHIGFKKGRNIYVQTLQRRPKGK